jgi:hypothetical protein
LLIIVHWKHGKVLPQTSDQWSNLTSQQIFSS